MPRKPRIDEELVRQGLFSSKGEAERAVMAGLVSGEGIRFAHPGDTVKEGLELHVKGRRTFASRGGEKLCGALQDFGICVEGLRCLDMGCSSGGFTDALLQAGAASVLAVDVGRAQFAWELRNDTRVELLERTKGQELAADMRRKESVDFAVCDVSFCSAIDVLEAMFWVLKPEGEALILVKPQFEAKREDVGEGGVVGDPAVQRAAVERVQAAYEKAGFSAKGTVPSRVKGAHGNQEFFVWFNKE